MVYQGISGMVYDIEEKKFKGGGEGSIHLIHGNDRQVAKIFKAEKRDAQREQKLKLMVQMNKFTEEQLKHVTWPQDVIYGQKGFAGYIMPKAMSVSSLTQLYSDEDYDLRYRLFSAINLCAAIDDVHAVGQVCGDLNPQNICINLDKNGGDDKFQITLVDVDSYHFAVGDTIYRCEVGLPDYLAPEIQKKVSGGLTLRNAALPTYTRETDLFALAVHIFLLLMNGCHPFACAKDTNRQEGNIARMGVTNNRNSVVAPQPIENIRDGFFPFYQTKNGISTPVYAPDFNMLPKELQDMFVRAFVKGYDNPSCRPSALEWQTVLIPYLVKMVRCDKNHYYFSHLNVCPFCKVNDEIAKLFGNLNQQPASSGFEGNQQEIPIPPSSSPLQSSPLGSASKKRHVGWRIFLAVAAILVMFFGAIVDYSAKELKEKHSQTRYNELGQDEAYDGEIAATEYNGLMDKIRQDFNETKIKEEKAAQKAKADAKEIKKLNKIISAIKNKKYKKAGTLTEKYCINHIGLGKVYVQKKKIVDSIKSGKGFMIDHNTFVAYYGDFKKGKKHGKGIDVGIDAYGDNYKVQGEYKNNKLNGKATIYEWNQGLGKNTYNAKVTGKYKNNKEHGRLSVTYEYKSGGVFHTYYYNSLNGKRSIIRYDSDVGYVYAQTLNGNDWIGLPKKKWLSGHGHPGHFLP